MMKFHEFFQTSIPLSDQEGMQAVGVAAAFSTQSNGLNFIIAPANGYCIPGAMHCAPTVLGILLFIC
jgi:hypothetical protein